MLRCTVSVSEVLHPSAFFSASVTAGLNVDRMYARHLPYIQHEFYVSVVLKPTAGLATVCGIPLSSQIDCHFYNNTKYLVKPICNTVYMHEYKNKPHHQYVKLHNDDEKNSLLNDLRC